MIIYLKSGLFILCTNYVLSEKLMYEMNEDALEIANMIENFGYPMEVHQVSTQDGYILTNFRIPHGRINRGELQDPRKRQAETGKPVALFMHGLFGSTNDFLCTGPAKSLALLMAENGYDVWLANARGNIVSRNHVRLDPDKDLKFWDYSWHEIGFYDIPANIDYILNATGKKELVYVGLSQGTTSFFVMCSEKPEYNKHIKLMIALAPVAFMTHVQGLPRAFSENINVFKKWLVPISYEVLPRSLNREIRNMFKMYCNNGNIFQEVCVSVALQTIGVNLDHADHFNRSLVPECIKFGMTGSSVKQLYHFGQLVMSDKFEKYDYGKEKNLIKYNSVKAPSYNLSKVTAPVALFYGEDDVYAIKEDMDRLISELSNVIIAWKIPYKNFNHFDYIIADGVEDILYTKIFQLLSQ